MKVNDATHLNSASAGAATHSGSSLVVAFIYARSGVTVIFSRQMLPS